MGHRPRAPCHPHILWLLRLNGDPKLLYCRCADALVQQHSERRRLAAVRAPPVPAELRCDVHLVEVRGTDEPPEPHWHVTVRPAARDDRVGRQRRLVLGGHICQAWWITSSSERRRAVRVVREPDGPRRRRATVQCTDKAACAESRPRSDRKSTRL